MNNAMPRVRVSDPHPCTNRVRSPPLPRTPECIRQPAFQENAIPLTYYLSLHLDVVGCHRNDEVRARNIHSMLVSLSRNFHLACWL